MNNLKALNEELTELQNDYRETILDSTLLQRRVVSKETNLLNYSSSQIFNPQLINIEIVKMYNEDEYTFEVKFAIQQLRRAKSICIQIQNLEEKIATLS